MLMLTFLQRKGTEVAGKSFKFRLVAVYVPNAAVKRVFFFRRL